MIILRIVFHGLIAFVPSPHHSQMTALLVASLPDPNQCIAKHDARLMFPTGDSDKCIPAVGCSYGADHICTCTLDYKTIAFPVSALPASTEPGHQPPHVLPATKDAAADMAYLVNMSNLGYDILRTAVTGDPGNPPLVARMVFPYTRLAACDLATDQGDDDLPHSYNFHPYLSAQVGWDQPLAQGLVTEADVPSGDVSLELNTLGASGSPTTFKLTATCVHQKCTAEVTLENTRDPYIQQDPCNDGVGRDFAFYYDLTTVPLSFAFRPVPEVDDVAGNITAGDLEPAMCPARTESHGPLADQASWRQRIGKRHGRREPIEAHATTVYSHPVCAMAVFYPYQ
jgi:hypothetical protein